MTFRGVGDITSPARIRLLQAITSQANETRTTNYVFAAGDRRLVVARLLLPARGRR